VVETGDGFIHVEYGKIRAFADAFASLDTVTFGRFRDDLTFTAPGVPTGAFFDVDFKATVNGFMQTADPGVGQVRWLLQVALGSNVFVLGKSGCQGSVMTSCPGTNGDPLDHTYVAEAMVQAGIPAQLDFEFTNSAEARIGGDFQPGGATGNFLDTIAWGGILSVTNNGVPITNYSVSSSSGTDWTKDFIGPVTGAPEPPSCCVIAGAVALALLLRCFR
jgi:hypothetical protein